MHARTPARALHHPHDLTCPLSGDDPSPPVRREGAGEVGDGSVCCDSRKTYRGSPGRPAPPHQGMQGIHVVRRERETRDRNTEIDVGANYYFPRGMEAGRRTQVNNFDDNFTHHNTSLLPPPAYHMVWDHPFRKSKMCPSPYLCSICGHIVSPHQ